MKRYRKLLLALFLLFVLAVPPTCGAMLPASAALAQTAVTTPAPTAIDPQPQEPWDWPQESDSGPALIAKVYLPTIEIYMRYPVRVHVLEICDGRVIGPAVGVPVIGIWSKDVTDEKGYAKVWAGKGDWVQYYNGNNWVAACRIERPSDLSCEGAIKVVC